MPQMMAVLAPGFAAIPAKFALAVDLSRITFPYLLLICLAALVVGRAERARPLHRRLGLLCAVQRRLDRLHAVADALRADRRPRAVMGRSPYPASRNSVCCCGRCNVAAWACRCRARA